MYFQQGNIILRLSQEDLLGELAIMCFVLVTGCIHLHHSVKEKSISVTNNEKLLGKFAVQEREELRTRVSCSGGKTDFGI